MVVLLLWCAELAVMETGLQEVLILQELRSLVALMSPLKPIFRLGILKTDSVVFWDQSFPIFLCDGSSMAALCAECLHKMRGKKPNSQHFKLYII